MQAKPELRKSERFGHKFIIKLEDNQAVSPHYAVSYNLSEKGMFFKSLFELLPGVRISIRIDDYTLSRNQIPAKVVWCAHLEDNDNFQYGVGVEFLRLEKNLGPGASRQSSPRGKAPRQNEGESVIEL
jgi:hypothetical protein